MGAMFSATQYVQSGDKAGERCMRRPCSLAVAPMDNTGVSSVSGVFTVPGEEAALRCFKCLYFEN
jgi:hypothetical protein